MSNFSKPISEIKSAVEKMLGSYVNYPNTELIRERLAAEINSLLMGVIENDWKYRIKFTIEQDGNKLTINPVNDETAALFRCLVNGNDKLESRIIGPIPPKDGWGFCPICGAEEALTCRCFRRDAVCKNGHEYHICVKHKVFVYGQGDHSLPTDACTCGKDQEDDKG